ncbi:MAG: phosphomannomutase/phosphoglucomutase [bacterium]|nr:phosphomannomutase/phosphoglucomutase [bacterium]
MKVNPGIFRTYDIRGKYGEEISQEFATQLAHAFLVLYPHMKKIAVAHDPAPNSPLLAATLKEVFLQQGKEVIDLGLSPDPLYYFSLFFYGYDGGVMVSSSHVIEFSGFTLTVRKPGSPYVEDVVEEELEKIKELVGADAKTNIGESRGSVTALDPSKDYQEYVSSRIRFAAPLKIIVDCGNGAMGFLPERVFKALGCEVITLYGEFDGTYPNHIPDPYVEANLQDLKRAVLRERADVGFAYDADGDRVALIDNRGRVVSGDFCLLMLALQAIEKKKGPVVHDMRVSQAFLDEVRKQGVETYFAVSHHNAIIRKLREVNGVFGGEVTLHFLFPSDYYLCDDALFASLKLAEIMSDKKDFAAFVDTLPRYVASPELFIATPDDKKFLIINKLTLYLKEHGYDVVDVDGARIQFKNGWALARAANTSPFIKCRFEGKTKEDLFVIEKESLELFKKLGIPVEKKHYEELGLESTT